MDELNISCDWGPIVRNTIRALPENSRSTLCDILRSMPPTDSVDIIVEILLNKAEAFDNDMLDYHANVSRHFASLLNATQHYPKYRILLVSTAAIKTPPDKYGGMERMVDYLSRALAILGQDVAVAAKRGSSNDYLIFPADDEKEFPSLVDGAIRAGEYDVVIDFSHDKMIGRAFPDFPQINTYQVMTTSWKRNPVFISSAQQAHIGLGGPVIYYGLRLEDYPVGYEDREPYLLYMGSIIPEKRVEWAVGVADLLEMGIKIAGPSWTPDYFNETVKPLIDLPNVEYVGDVGGSEKLELLQKAAALIHPVGGQGWVEAGAIIVQEALACGTPVIGSTNGCLPEYIKPGINGVMGESPQQMAENYANAGWTLDGFGAPWSVCRRSISGFNWIRMAQNYIDVVHRVVDHQENW
jgi:glycosyltransferase involved in cell wall biosynthesis